MTLNTLIADLASLGLTLTAESVALAWPTDSRAWTDDGRAGVALNEDGTITVLDVNGYPTTRDGSGRVADAHDAAREIRRILV